MTTHTAIIPRKLTGVLAAATLASGLALTPQLAVAPAVATTVENVSAPRSGDATGNHNWTGPKTMPVETIMVEEGIDPSRRGFDMKVDKLEPGKTYTMMFNRAGDSGNSDTFKATADNRGVASFHVYMTYSEDYNTAYLTGTYNMAIVEKAGDSAPITTSTIELTDKSNESDPGADCCGNEFADPSDGQPVLKHDKTIGLSEFLSQPDVGFTENGDAGIGISVEGLEPNQAYVLRIKTEQGTNEDNVTIKADENGHATMHMGVIADEGSQDFKQGLLGTWTVELLKNQGDSEALASSTFEVTDGSNAGSSTGGGSQDADGQSTDQPTANGQASGDPSGKPTETAGAGGDVSGSSGGEGSNATDNEASNASDGLPRTGITLGGLGLGAVLLAGGVAAIFISRKRA